ncbi:unnamed protein product [Haemonchus placei]|uniref:TUG-UBL1 domain-containing protein n=1 Tax=Haemonchus placei TaxID=6290 RepID=A0A0N4X7P3_HAEPC|nr:unnamed protein product [Haemonchus placei]
MSSVTVLCPNAKRCPVRVTPSMLMKQVLEEACLKNGFDADEYKLLNQNRHIDLALPFRLSGLPNNATLEMVKATKNVSNSVVTIALQLPSGSRMENTFPVTSSLFEMLAFFSQSANKDLTATDDSSTPTCSYMNRQYTGPAELRSTTFSSIGISTGKCLIRYQRVPLSKEQQNEIAARIANDAAEKEALLANYERMKAENESRAQLEAARLKRFEEELRLEEERKKSISAMTAVEERANTNNQVSQYDEYFLLVDTSLSRPQSEHDRLTDILAQEGRVPLSRIAIEATRSEESEEAPPVVSPANSTPPCERQPVVFQRRMKFEWNDMEAGLSDDFFEVSVDDVKARQKELREEVRLSTQRALISAQYVKQKNRERKLTAYRHTVIRIPLCNERMIQAQFLSAEPVARLFEWIRSIISRNIPFSIKLALIYNIEESTSMNFVDAELAPKSTVVVRFRDSMSFESLLLKDKLQECTQDEADRLSTIWLSVNSMFKPYTAVVEEEERITKRPGGTRDSTNSDYAPPPEKTSSAPRWLRRN